MRPKSLSAQWADFEDEWNSFDPNWSAQKEEEWDNRLSDLERVIEVTPAKCAADVVVKLRLLKFRCSANLDADADEGSNAHLVDTVIDWVVQRDGDIEQEFPDGQQ